MSGNVSFSQKGPGLEKLKADLLALSRMEVLVGIPENDAERGDINNKRKGSITRVGTDTINNAFLLYIHTHGIRRRPMINEMQPDLDSGVPYSAAHQMYIQAHGSPMWASPPRPVIEPAIEAPGNKEQIAAELAKVAKLAMNGEIAAAKRQLRAVGRLGANIAEKWFTDPRNNWAPNSPETIARKGSARPLVDKAYMRRAITFVVRGDKRD